MFMLSLVPFCPDECEYLKPNEINQENNHTPHICTKFGKRVLHKSYHPKLVRLEECVGEFSDKC